MYSRNSRGLSPEEFVSLYRELKFDPDLKRFSELDISGKLLTSQEKKDKKHIIRKLKQKISNSKLQETRKFVRYLKRIYKSENPNDKQKPTSGQKGKYLEFEPEISYRLQQYWLNNRKPNFTSFKEILEQVIPSGIKIPDSNGYFQNFKKRNKERLWFLKQKPETSNSLESSSYVSMNSLSRSSSFAIDSQQSDNGENEKSYLDKILATLERSLNTSH